MKFLYKVCIVSEWIPAHKMHTKILLRKPVYFEEAYDNKQAKY